MEAGAGWVDELEGTVPRRPMEAKQFQCDIILFFHDRIGIADPLDLSISLSLTVLACSIGTRYYLSSAG
jgi:hypothetical protein